MALEKKGKQADQIPKKGVEIKDKNHLTEDKDITNKEIRETDLLSESVESLAPDDMYPLW